MKHVAAYALLVLGGKAKPTAADIEKLLKDSGVQADSDKAAALVKACDGKDFHELVEQGLGKLATMGSGSGAPAAAGGATAAAPAKEEKQEEEEDVNMGGLFGDDEEDY